MGPELVGSSSPAAVMAGRLLQLTPELDADPTSPSTRPVRRSDQSVDEESLAMSAR